MRSNSDYKNTALAALKGNWAEAVLCTVVYIAVVSALVSYPMVKSVTGSMAFTPGIPYLWYWPVSIAMFLILGNLETGFYNAFRILVESGDNRLTSNMFRSAFRAYFHKLLGYFLYGVIVMAGFMLFLIPGIIWAFAYSMVPYILDDEPQLSIVQTFRKSRLLMKGHKFDYFWLCLSFIGWGILSILTLGIGLLWLAPYLQTASAAFYEDLKGLPEGI